MQLIAPRVPLRAGGIALLFACLLSLCAAPARAVDSMSVGDAQKLMFPDATAFDEQPAGVTAQWQQRAADDPDLSFLGARIVVWRVRRGDDLIGWFYTDNVIGKFEKVDYAVAFSPDGKVRRVEVLKYREKHGYEVRQRSWLAQFEGRDASSGYRLERDIDGISGATLSCNHLTAGIQRLAKMMAIGLQAGGR